MDTDPGYGGMTADEEHEFYGAMVYREKSNTQNYYIQTEVVNVRKCPKCGHLMDTD